MDGGWRYERVRGERVRGCWKWRGRRGRRRGGGGGGMESSCPVWTRSASRRRE